MNIADYIPMGKENAVSRARLVRLTGLPDRAIRDHIKRANRVLTLEGREILSSSGARGYWISDDLAEMEEYLRESTHRARTQFFNDAPIRSLVMRRNDTKTVQVRAYTRRVRVKTETDGQTRLEV